MALRQAGSSLTGSLVHLACAAGSSSGGASAAAANQTLQQLG
jgi:hypothetical protein